jgi:hypothetical protein
MASRASIPSLSRWCANSTIRILFKARCPRALLHPSAT